MPGTASTLQNLANNSANQEEPGSDQAGIDLERLAAELYEKLRHEIEIENERLGRAWDR